MMPARLSRTTPVDVAFVVHVMQMAGAERLVVETITRLGRRINPTVFCLDALGTLGEELRARGVEVEVLDRQPGVDVRVSLRLAAALRRRGIRVVHAHQYTPFFYSALAKMRLLGALGVILTEHGRHFPDVVGARRRTVNRVCLSRLADRVNAVCAFSADALARHDGFPRERIEVIPNGVDFRSEEYAGTRRVARVLAGLPPFGRVIVSIGRFHPVKDHETLIRGFAHVRDRLPDVGLLLAGDGPLRGQIEALVDRLRLSDRVRFLGVRRDVPVLLRAADAFCLTSLSEAASLTVLEAMAAGTPMVLTNVGGNPELARHDREAFLVPRGDAAAVGAALVELLTNTPRAERMGAAATRRVREMFALEATIDRYFALYLELAGAA